MNDQMLRVIRRRRAKLKRLTVDDRESILKSRALPIGFDTFQALHHRHPDAPSSFSHDTDSGYVIDGDKVIRREWPLNEATDMPSPTSMPSSFEGYYHHPSSNTTEIISSTSPSSETPCFFTPPVSQGTSPRTQAQNVRSRAASLALPLYANAARTQELVERHEPPLAGLHQNITSHRWPQQHLFARPISINASATYAQRQTSLQNQMAGYYPYSSMYNTRSPDNPRRASDTSLINKQSVRPVRPAQSAPLAAPPDFLVAQQSSSSQLLEANPPFEVPCGQGVQSSHSWEPDQSFTVNQMDTASHFWNQSDVFPPSARRNDQDDTTPKPEELGI